MEMKKDSMRWIRFPAELILPYLALLILPLFAVVLTILLTELPWWKIPQSHLLTALALGTALAMGIVFLDLLSFRTESFILKSLLQASFLGLLTSALFLQKVGLGVFSLFGSIAWLSYCEFLSQINHRSYFPLGLSFFDPCPSPISQVKVFISDTQGLKVAKIDAHSALLYSTAPIQDFSFETSQFLIQFQSDRLFVDGVIYTFGTLLNGEGIICGVRWQFQDPDQQLEMEQLYQRMVGFGERPPIRLPLSPAHWLRHFFFFLPKNKDPKPKKPKMF